MIVVGQGDEASLRAAVTEVSQGDPRIRYIHNSLFGASSARNTGIRAAQGDMIAFIDDDCTAQSDWLSVLGRFFDDEPRVGLVGGSVVIPARTQSGVLVCPHVNPPEAIYDPVACNYKPPAGWDWIGSNMTMRREVFTHVGLFDEVLGPGTAYPCGEDTDYKFRAEAAHVVMGTTPRAVVVHTHGIRYGLRASLRITRNYAIGNGGFSAKLTMANDVRGVDWLHKTVRQCYNDGSRFLRPDRVLLGLRRLWYFRRAYDRLLHDYELDTEQHILRLKNRQNSPG